MISTDDYFKGHPDLRTPELEAAADGLLEKVDALRLEAEGAGVDFFTNPHTGTDVAGDGNGGIRPIETKVGAPDSQHKHAHAVDVYDPSRKFASWCLAHFERLVAYGLHMEDPRWTWSQYGNHWVHLKDMPPVSGKVM